jgi:glutaredoxin
MTPSIPDQLIDVFGRETCTDTRSTRDLLERLDIPYRFHDIEAHARHRAEAVALSGEARVPVVRMPDGEIAVEPSDEWMLARLGRAEPNGGQ